LDRGADPLPDLAHQTLLLIARTIEGLTEQIGKIEIELMTLHQANPTRRRQGTIVQSPT
jgi:hypothetical protein